MATVKQCVEIMRGIAPEQFTYEYDNVGLLVGSFDAQVKTILCCLDVTDSVLDEATDKGVDLIISHHPMLFTPIKRVTDSDVVGRKIIKAIKNGINIYAAHTNLDFVTEGINEYCAELLGVEKMRPLEPYIDNEQGFGRVGNLSEYMTVSELRRRAAEVFSDPFVGIIGDENKVVSKIAVINGSGGGDTSYIDMALREQADCLITAEVKHHVAIYALDNRLTIIEPRHYTMEKCYIKNLADKLRNAMKCVDPTAKIFQSESETNVRK